MIILQYIATKLCFKCGYKSSQPTYKYRRKVSILIQYYEFNCSFKLGSVQYLTGPGVAGFTGGVRYTFFRSGFRGGYTFFVAVEM